MTPPVTQAARDAAANLSRKRGKSDEADYRGYVTGLYDHSDFVLAFAKAIAAERERCALIAEGVLYHPHPDLCEEEEGWNDAATHIATAIRATVGEVGK